MANESLVCELQFVDTVPKQFEKVRAFVSRTEVFPKIKPRKRSSILETVVEAFHLPTISGLSQSLDRSKYGLCVKTLGKLHICGPALQRIFMYTCFQFSCANYGILNKNQQKQ